MTFLLGPAALNETAEPTKRGKGERANALVIRRHFGVKLMYTGTGMNRAASVKGKLHEEAHEFCECGCGVGVDPYRSLDKIIRIFASCRACCGGWWANAASERASPISHRLLVLNQDGLV